MSALLGVAVGITLALVLSLGVSIPSLRLHDEYFIVATLAFQMIAFSILNNWSAVTNGPLGISGIPQPSLLGLTISSLPQFALLSAGLALVAYLAVRRISKGPAGRVLRAIREDEVFVQSLGKDTLGSKVSAVALAAAFAASAGSAYAHYISFVDPTSFTVGDSILVVSMVIIGGRGTAYGPLIGAVVLAALPEALRFVGFPRSTAAHLRQVLYGSLLVAMILLKPSGLLGHPRRGGTA
jgi:branched-chain amino acid transport system permease protein